MDVRGRQLSDIGVRLREVSKAVESLSSPQHWYFLIDQTLYPLRGMLTRRSPIRWPRALLRLPMEVDRIRLKNNIRIFWRERVTIKAPLPDGKPLLREIRARRIIAGKAGLERLVPRIIQSDRCGRWFVEDAVTAATPVPALEKVRRFIEGPAHAYYSATARIRRIGDDCIPVALCHGDLTAGNMLIEPSGGIKLVDFEHAKVMRVVDDLRKIYLHYIPLRERILRMLGALGTPECTPAGVQMARSLLRRVKYLETSRVDQLGYLQGNVGLSTSAAEEKLRWEMSVSAAEASRLEAGLQ